MSTTTESLRRLPPDTPFAAARLLGHLQRLRCGTLSGTLPDGRGFRIVGAEAGGEGALHLRAPGRLLLRCAARGAEGFAEGYMAGDWDSPDLAALLSVMADNEAAFGQREARLLTAAELTVHRWRNRNTLRGSRRNIAAHYDLGNDFYRLWLDETMTYSAALFTHPGQPLAEAQRAKYDALIDGLDAGPGAHILEIGCGWGGFALRAAERGFHVTGITLSAEQLAWAREAVAAAGLEQRVTLRLQDYRDLEGCFDHVVSIEMLEAVGEAYWPRYFAALARHVRPGGRIGLHSITIDGDHFAAYRRNPDFIQRYIFPGGMLPTRERLLTEAETAGLRVLACDGLGDHYAETLARWHRRFRAQEDTVRAQGFDRRFRRMWRYYLAYCEAGFRIGRVDLQRLILQRPPA
ncbi:class I SAM-dependent methyltransferase [Arhodomonas sp. SL1]|uniref:class I SAM-dependent methyltransferase n=1 Tax=Arhodomonas sp. SL1 TaxID=3425691 RepID=UPI003F88358D